MFMKLEFPEHLKREMRHELALSIAMKHFFQPNLKIIDGTTLLVVNQPSDELYEFLRKNMDYIADNWSEVKAIKKGYMAARVAESKRYFMSALLAEEVTKYKKDTGHEVNLITDTFGVERIPYFITYLKRHND